MSVLPAVSRWDALSLEKVTEMVSRKEIRGADVQFVQAYFKKGAVVPLHAHAVEILVYVLQGAVRFRVGGAEVTVRDGEVVALPRDVAHQAECLDDTFVLTVTPAQSVG